MWDFSHVGKWGKSYHVIDFCDILWFCWGQDKELCSALCVSYVCQWIFRCLIQYIVYKCCTIVIPHFVETKIKMTYEFHVSKLKSETKIDFLYNLLQKKRYVTFSIHICIISYLMIFIFCDYFYRKKCCFLCQLLIYCSVWHSMLI